MSAAENPNLQVVADPARQLPPAQPLHPAIAAAADWVGWMRAQIAELFTSAYRGSRNGSVSLAESIRDRSQRIKEENPMAVLAGIAGTAFAAGIVVRILRSRH